jgi:deoxycytidine triphosphate deaminase
MEILMNLPNNLRHKVASWIAGVDQKLFKNPPTSGFLSDSCISQRLATPAATRDGIIQQLKSRIIPYSGPKPGEELRGASLDLILGPHFEIPTQDGVPIQFTSDGPLHLKPGSFMLGSTLHSIGMPTDRVGWLTVRSGQARLGLQTEANDEWWLDCLRWTGSSNMINPGFYGKIVVEIYNPLSFPVTIQPCQVAPISLLFGAIEGEVQNPDFRIGSHFGQMVTFPQHRATNA